MLMALLASSVSVNWLLWKTDWKIDNPFQIEDRCCCVCVCGISDV
jgi:hypothetical protein